MSKKKEPTQMDKITAGYEKFIKGKELNPYGSALFEKVLKKAVGANPKKQHGSK